MTNNGVWEGFKVLSPWADTDPVLLKGISPRLSDLADRKIGLFVNSKRAAALIMSAIDAELKDRYPSITTSWYESTGPNVMEIETSNRAKFEAWVQGVDAVILAVGD